MVGLDDEDTPETGRACVPPTPDRSDPPEWHSGSSASGWSRSPMRSPLLNLAVVMAEEEQEEAKQQEEQMARLRQQQQVQTDPGNNSLAEWAVCEWATYEAEKHNSREMSPARQRDLRHQTSDPVSPEMHIQRLEMEKAAQHERIKQLERINREKDEQIRNLSPGRERAAGGTERAAGDTHDLGGGPTLTTTQSDHLPNDLRGGSHGEGRGGANGGGSNADLSGRGGEWRAVASSVDLQQRIESSPETGEDPTSNVYAWLQLELNDESTNSDQNKNKLTWLNNEMNSD